MFFFKVSEFRFNFLIKKKAIERHKGRIVKLEYDGTGSSIDTTLLLVGKGITYDTGGADIKYGGNMAGMHR